jgi:hypothetical protein
MPRPVASPGDFILAAAPGVYRALADLLAAERADEV